MPTSPHHIKWLLHFRELEAQIQYFCTSYISYCNFTIHISLQNPGIILVHFQLSLDDIFEHYATTSRRVKMVTSKEALQKWLKQIHYAALGISCQFSVRSLLIFVSTISNVNFGKCMVIYVFLVFFKPLRQTGMQTYIIKIEIRWCLQGKSIMIINCGDVWGVN